MNKNLKSVVIKRIQQNIVLEVISECLPQKNYCIALGVGKNYVHVCFVVVYLGSKTSPDGLSDFLMKVFSYYVRDLLVFHHPFTNYQSNESNARIFEHR